LEEALAAAAAEPFDKARAQASLAGIEPDPAKNAVDALEHFHNILTPEQRDKLDQILLGKSEWR
jgi:Spy/CpxP family protein refolding chaperone